jgi:hypothetical protein
MSDLFWLTDEQVERLRPFFPKSHGKPRVDERWVDLPPPGELPRLSGSSGADYPIPLSLEGAC